MHEFDPTERLIRCWARITIGGRSADLSMALDTACSQSVVTLDAIATLIYDRAPVERSIVVTASGEASGDHILLDEMTSLGTIRREFPVLAVDLPASLGVDGLLGLDFFRKRHLHIDFENGYISLQDPPPKIAR
jgi:hypothetical protein